MVVSMNHSVTLTDTDSEFVSELLKITKEKLQLEYTPDEIVAKIINNFRDENTFFCLFDYTKQVKFSLNEINRLSQLSKKELIALDYLMLSKNRNREIGALVRVIKRELDSEGKLASASGENVSITNLLNVLESEYDKRFKYSKFRSGVKKLIIKSVAVSYLERKDIIW